jgi:hypothetical protein
MANINSVFQQALADQAKAALADVVASQPKTTVAELAELVAANPTLGTITLGDLLGGGATKSAPPTPTRGRPGRKPAAAAPAAVAPAAAPAAPAAPKRKVVAPPASSGGGKKRNVRTEAGRESFDTDVLNALKELGGDTVAATNLRERLGADPTQLRASLNRLIEKGLVTFTGKARGTRYSLA